MGQLTDVSLYDVLPKDGEVFTFQASTIADTLDVIALADSGRIRADVDLFPLDRVAEAYERWRRAPCAVGRWSSRTETQELSSVSRRMPSRWSSVTIRRALTTLAFSIVRSAP